MPPVSYQSDSGPDAVRGQPHSIDELSGHDLIGFDGVMESHRATQWPPFARYTVSWPLLAWLAGPRNWAKVVLSSISAMALRTSSIRWRTLQVSTSQSVQG